MKGQLLMLLRQYRILLKRTSKKFINLLLLLIIPFTAFYIKNLPVEEKSTVFICGYYMEESNSYLAQVEQELSGHQDCFTFEKCSSMEELKDQVASGRYDCGFAFDNGFSDAFIHDIKNCHIRLYTSRQSFPKHYSTGCWMLSRRLLLPTIWHRILPQKTFIGVLSSHIWKINTEII
jgi:hypothetical protein